MSVSITITAQGAEDSFCSTDYIEIPGAQVTSSGSAVTNIGLFGTISVTRFCGRMLGTNAATITTHSTFCTGLTPFEVRVRMNDNEQYMDTATSLADLNEPFAYPSGTVGFRLTWTTNCP